MIAWYRKQLDRVRYRRRMAERWLRGRRPRADVFAGVYRSNLWGGNPGEFYSGDGSLPLFAEPYCAYLREFIVSLGCQRVTVVDLGCGDFRVGAQLVSSVADRGHVRIEYVGVDVVEALIERNRRRHAAPNVTFACADIVADELPAGDVCLVRQVLQHLSNAEIQRILPKLARYPHVFVTEHFPSPGAALVPNRDKPHGSEIRVEHDSAVCLDQPPFGLERVELVLTHPYYDWGELRTFRIDGARTLAGAPAAGRRA